MYYWGIDLHTDNCYITTIDEQGVIVKQEGVENISKLFLDYFQMLRSTFGAGIG